MTLRYFSFSIVLLILVTNCGGGSSENGDDTDNGEESGIEPTLSSIQENIFTPTCARSGCHSAATASNGLSLAEGDSFSELVGVPSADVPTLNRVEPGDPDNSYLMHKLRGTQSTVGGSGSQMPQGESSLSDEELDAIEEWITNGAEND